MNCKEKNRLLKILPIYIKTCKNAVVSISWPLFRCFCKCNSDKHFQAITNFQDKNEARQWLIWTSFSYKQPQPSNSLWKASRSRISCNAKPLSSRGWAVVRMNNVTILCGVYRGFWWHIFVTLINTNQIIDEQQTVQSVSGKSAPLPAFCHGKDVNTCCDDYSMVYDVIKHPWQLS